jgi:S-methylmethionine-dependent homocysteine/selenocysteine methylase
VATELQRHRSPVDDDDLWGTWALYRAPRAVLEVHRTYAAAGCHVISTDTWSILSAPEIGSGSASRIVEAQHWMDIARMGVRLARQAVDDNVPATVPAFAISEEANSERRDVELLTQGSSTTRRISS